jgi:hypothetical protein
MRPKPVTREVKNSINFRRNFFAAVVWLKSENVAGTAGVIQEGIAVDPLLARAGWNLAMLIWCGRSATTLVAAGHKNKAGFQFNTTIERTMVNLT